MKIAGYELHSIETGRFALDGGAMFGIVPKALWEKQIQADEKNRIPMAMRCLLLIGNGRVVLVDNGAGNKFDAKLSSVYDLDTEHSELHRSLHAVGVSVKDITDVILTHLHFDHCGGSTVRNGDTLEIAFPNAMFHVQESQWEWTKKPNLRERNSFLAENLAPLAASGQLNLLQGEQTLFEGVSVQVFNGHTTGMQAVSIADAQNTLVFPADLLPTAAHLLPVWVMGYDLFPLTSIDEKVAFLETALAKNWQLMFEHDAHTEVASLMRDAKGNIVATDARTLQEL